MEINKMIKLVSLTILILIYSTVYSNVSSGTVIPLQNDPCSINQAIIANNNDSSIFYFGNWVITTGAPGFFSNDYRSSNTQYNRCLFIFKSPYVKWFGSKNNNHGLADIYIDDIFQETVDSYSPLLTTNALLFQKFGLDPEIVHTLSIVVRKDKNNNSIGCYQDIDYFESDKPINYVKHIRGLKNDEYRQIGNSEKSYVLPTDWHPLTYKAVAPADGVTLQAGVFNDVFSRNIKYLNHCFASPTYCDGEGWVKWLPASNDGRMLSGAGNTLRWAERADMRKIVETIIKNIKSRARADGYHNYYPETESFTEKTGINSERKNYDRVFWTRGMLAAGRSGNSDAFTIVRNFYNWFNASPFLPGLLTGNNATNGLPGGGLIFHSPVGLPDDLVVTERYFDQDYWINELSQGQPLCVSNYPGINPHCYEFLGLEAFLDEYMATGSQKYIDAAKGGWEIINRNFEHIGGTISICEWTYFPPKSLYLNSHTGETCGSVFWVNINEKLMHLYPDEEKYAAEIEKTIYNVIMAAQDSNGYIRYHNKLHDRKEEAKCINTCCEVSSTGLIGKLPEYLYSVVSVPVRNATTCRFKTLPYKNMIN